MKAEVLAAAIGIPLARATEWADEFTETFERFHIDTPERQAAFLAQVAEESGQLLCLEENLNYKNPLRLMKVFPKDIKSKQDLEARLFAEGKTNFPQRTPEQIALAYVGKPEAIANWVYANQNGNGDEASGDGWLYRGGGLIQITGRGNYKDCGRGIGLDLVNNPELLRQAPYTPAALSAGWYWWSRNLNALADKGDFKGITYRVNGGYNGLEARTKYWEKAKLALA